MAFSSANCSTILTIFSRSSQATLLDEARGNTLFRNAGDGTFRDVSWEARITMGRWAWGSIFTDFNNDGRLDMVVPNGFLTNTDSKDL